MYVQRAENYTEFKTIILGRVAAKIKELNNFTLQERERYIANQTKIVEERHEKHQEMAQYAPLAQDSEAHTISEQPMLQELQNQFQADTQSSHTIAHFGISNSTPAGQQALIEIARLAAQNSGF